MGNPDTVVRDGSDARTRTRLVRTRRGKENEHSGFVIVRLNAEVPATAGDSLIDVAKRSKLGGLAAALEAFKVTTTRRLVRSLAA